LLRSRLDDGPSIIMVEHVTRAIRSLCRLIVVLDAGRVIASGSPQQALGNRDVIPLVYSGDRLAPGGSAPRVALIDQSLRARLQRGAGTAGSRPAGLGFGLGFRLGF
jgi:ABC-type multidrug transport system ATPase subunit